MVLVPGELRITKRQIIQMVHMEGPPIRPGEIPTSLNRTQTKKAVRRRASNELRTIADREQIASDRILEMAIASFERWNSRYGKIYYKPTDQLEYELIQIVARAIRDEVAELPVLEVVRLKPRARVDLEEVHRLSKVLTDAFEEGLDYDPKRKHNQRVPALWVDDPTYRADVQALLIELRQLNSELINKRGQRPGRSAIVLAPHINKFLASYATTLGHGTAALTIATMARLLSAAGLTGDYIQQVWSHIKFSR